MSRLDRPTSAFCVGVSGGTVRPPDALRRRTHLDGRADSFHTATPDTTRLSRLPVDRRRDVCQAGSMQLFLDARPPARSDVVRQENVNTLWIVAYD